MTLHTPGAALACTAEARHGPDLMQHCCRADPLYRASSVPDALRLRHRVQGHLAQGICRRQRHSMPSEGLASAERCQHVALDDKWTDSFSTRNLVLRDLRTRAEIHSWPLPRLDYVDDRPVTWRWDGHLLSLNIGNRGQGQGLLLVNTDTGTCTMVHAETELWLVSMSHWSCTGRLLVQYSAEIGGGDAVTFSTITAQGRVHSIVAPTAKCSIQTNAWIPAGHATDCWAPDGHAAVLIGDTNIWLWEDGSSQLIDGQLAGAECLYCVIWAWDSRRLLIEAGDRRVIIWASPGDQHLVRMASAYCVGWGRQDRAVLLRVGRAGAAAEALSDESSSDESSEDIPEADQLHALVLCEVARNGALRCLDLGSRAPLYKKCPTVSVSPDGVICCLTNPGARGQTCGLDMLDLVKQKLLRRFHVPFLPVSMEWSADSARLAVMCEKKRTCVLLDFA